MTADDTIVVDDIDAGLAAAEPRLTATEQRLAVTTYRLLATGEPVTVQAAATTTGMANAEVQRLWHAWPSVYFDHQDSSIGFWGLALRPMPHRLRIAGVELFAWCAWDPLFPPSSSGQ
jgi:alkylmercury lyase